MGRVIEFFLFALAAAGTVWLMRRKHRQRVAAGPPAGIPGMARRPAGEGRWRSGRVYAGGGAARWQPGGGAAVALAGARHGSVRGPSVREGLSINPGSRIVACAAAGGGPDVEVAVMAPDLEELLAGLPPAPAPAPAPGGTGGRAGAD